MGILDLGVRSREQYHECRRCGKTVGPDTDRCPTCDAADIVTYEF